MIDLTEILKDDELQLFSSAVNGLREQGFGEVTLYFRNGYVYRVKVSIDSYHKNNNGKEDNSG